MKREIQCPWITTVSNRQCCLKAGHDNEHEIENLGKIPSGDYAHGIWWWPFATKMKQAIDVELLKWCQAQFEAKDDKPHCLSAIEWVSVLAVGVYLHDEDKRLGGEGYSWEQDMIALDESPSDFVAPHHMASVVKAWNKMHEPDKGVS